MEFTSSRPRTSGVDGLLAATSAFRNVRALALMGLTLLAATLVTVVFGWIGFSIRLPFLAGLGALLSLLVAFYGINAVGILLMQDAQGQQSCSITDALLLSLFSAHRLIAVALLEFLIVLALVIVIGIALFLCKIPFIGPILLTFVYPAAAVVLGVTIFSLFYIMLPLAGPAIWSGSSIMQAIARLNMIIRTRLFAVVLQLFVLLLIAMLATAIIAAIIGLGLGTMTAMTSAIVSSSGMLSLMRLPSMLFGAFGFMQSYGFGMDGHVVAIMLGGALLSAIATIIPALIVLKGICIIYLKATEGMSFDAAEAQLESGLAAVRRKTEEARQRARKMAEEQMQKAREATAAAKANAAPEPPALAAPAPEAPGSHASESEAPASGCPSCNASVTPGDAFCGECGHKLQ